MPLIQVKGKITDIRPNDAQLLARIRVASDHHIRMCTKGHHILSHQLLYSVVVKVLNTAFPGVELFTNALLCTLLCILSHDLYPSYKLGAKVSWWKLNV